MNKDVLHSDDENNDNVKVQNKILNEQTHIFNKQTEIFENQIKLDKKMLIAARVGVFLGTLAFIVSCYSISTAKNANIMAEKANYIADKNIATSITPVVMVGLFPTDSNLYSLEVYNSGHGVAIDVNIDVHLADNPASTGNDGDGGYLYVDLAFKLRHKSRDLLKEFSNIGGLDINYYRNPPTVLHPSKFNWKIGEIHASLLSKLILVIDYKDITGKEYRSLWDGFSWSHSGGESSIVTLSMCNDSKNEYAYRRPTYVLNSVVSVKNKNENPGDLQENWLREEIEFYRPIMLYPYFVEWLRDEAQYYEGHGCVNAVEDFDLAISKLNSPRLDKRLLRVRNK